MPIRPALQVEEFDPDAVEAISAVFENVLGEFGLVDRTDPLVSAVAKRVIEFAKKGELDPHRLRQLVVKSFRS